MTSYDDRAWKLAQQYRHLPPDEFNRRMNEGLHQPPASTAADRVATLETALRTIQSAVPKYLKKEMTAEEFALVVIGEVDNKAVFRALEGKVETGRA